MIWHVGSQIEGVPQLLRKLHKTFARVENTKDTQEVRPLFLGTQEAAACWNIFAATDQTALGIQTWLIWKKYTDHLLIFGDELGGRPTPRLFVCPRGLVVSRLHCDTHLQAHFIQETHKLTAHAIRILSFQGCCKALCGSVAPRLVLVRCNIFALQLHHRDVLLVTKE